MKLAIIKTYNKFSNLGIREKLLLLFILLISLPVLIITTRSYYISSNVIDEKTNQYSHDILYQTTKMAESRLDKIEDISFNVAMDQEVQDTLLAVSTEELDDYEETQVRRRMEIILSSQVLYHNEIEAIYVVSFGGYVYELDKSKQQYGLMEEYINDIQEKKGGIAWFYGSSDNQYIALARLINSIRTQMPIGYLVIYVEESYLFELLASTHSVDEGNIFIVDADGVIVSDADKELLGTKSSTVNLLDETEAYSFTRQTIGGITQYVARSEPMSNGWRIITTVPVIIYQSEINSLRNSIILFAIILFIVSVLCAWGLSLSISRPIRSLSSTMVRFGEGDFSVRCPEGAKDETGKLSATFNQMADNINVLVQKVYDEQQMKRNAELKSLQMQINPHFLYNTLETINWMARIHGTNDIGIMAKSLGDLMRASIDMKDCVLLKDEILNLNNYLKIQKYRYGNKLEVIVDIAPDTEKLYVPKLIIQPLVENAIYHGIEPALDRGTIEVRSILENDNLLISVIDNGVGMTPDTIKHILDVDNIVDSSSPNSIGLHNVIKRIKTLYGSYYGIEIQSELGGGTKVTLRLPVLSKYVKGETEHE